VALPGRDLEPFDRTARVYLLSLQPTGRRAQASKLRLVAHLLGLEPGQIRWAGLRFEIMVAIRALLLEQAYAPSTINATLSALRGVAHSAWQLRQMRGEDYHRLRDVKGVKGTRLQSGRALSASEIAKLFTACTRDPTPAGARDSAMLALLFACGARRSECAALDLSDYSARTHALKVRGKGDKERQVYLESPGARRALRHWLRARGPEPGPLLCPVTKAGRIEHRRLSDQAIYNALVKRARQAGVRSFSPHDLRRTLLSELLATGVVDLFTVQSIAGHSSSASTRIYDHRDERARQAAARLVHVPCPSRRKK
jgi:site-specific recombinase XerD